jgi:hypothetical protein
VIAHEWEERMAVHTPERREVFRRKSLETRDVAVDHPARLYPATSDAGADGIKAMIDRISGTSLNEIERMIAELSGVRDILRSDAERVQREVAGYASMSHAALTSMQIIADSLAHWKSQSP